MTDADRHTGAGSAEAEAKARAEAALTRLPPRLRQAVVWLLSRWPGRIAVAGARVSLRVDIFDRKFSPVAHKRHAALLCVHFDVSPLLLCDPLHVTEEMQTARHG